MQYTSELRISIRDILGLWEQQFSTLKRIYADARRTFPSVNALITIPRADNDLLIFLASSRVCPEAPVFPTFSEPARSTRYRFPVF